MRRLLLAHCFHASPLPPAHNSYCCVTTVSSIRTSCYLPTVVECQCCRDEFSSFSYLFQAEEATAPPVPPPSSHLSVPQQQLSPGAVALGDCQHAAHLWRRLAVLFPKPSPNLLPGLAAGVRPGIKGVQKLVECLSWPNMGT